jgi:hypothetical protein
MHAHAAQSRETIQLMTLRVTRRYTQRNAAFIACIGEAARNVDQGQRHQQYDG